MKTFIVDSFTNMPFKGNPAGVCLLESPLSEPQMHSIAKELNFSETAFVFPREDAPNQFSIRYFSPVMEIPLCGHATLASSKVLFEKSKLNDIQFITGHGVELNIVQSDEQIVMEFPVYELEPTEIPNPVFDALGVSPEQAVNSEFNRETQIVLLEIKSTDVLKELKPDFQSLVECYDDIHGLLVTAPDTDGEFDFHSRFFWPWSGGFEDPVTGGTHTFLTKYWGTRLEKTKLRSFQASERTGMMDLELTEDGKLLIKAKAVILLEGDWVGSLG